MANKRMFSKQITTTDAFMEMPVSSQLLYFHLNMEADDDGFVSNPKRITKLIGAGEDDLKILLAKRFLLAFPSGVVVVKHWLIHNTLRQDRYNETKYIEEKKSLVIKENGAYTESGNQLATSWQPVGTTDIDKIRLDKNRTGYTEVFEEFWKEYPDRVAKGKAFDSWNKLSGEVHTLCVDAIKKQVLANHFKGKDGKDYFPHPATWINQKRWEDEVKSQKLNINKPITL